MNDTPLLMRAMKLSAGTVFFLSPANACYVNFVREYSLPAGVTLIGTPGRSILRPFTASESLAVIDHSDVTIQGITFDAAAPALSGTQRTLVFVSRATRVSLLNNTFLSSAPGGTSSGNAIWFWDSSGHIQGNDISSFQSQIIVKAGQGVKPIVFITGNQLHDNSTTGGNAIAITNDGGSDKVDVAVNVEDNMVQNISASPSSTGQDGNAVDLYLVNHVRVSNNHVNNVRFSCFRSASSDDSVFTGNACLNAGESAAYSEFTSHHNQWIDNYFENSHGSCLNLTNLDVGGQLHSAIGNHMVKCGTNGISVEGNAVVSGNLIDQASDAILIGYGSFGMNVLVKDNLITDTSGANLTRFGIGVEHNATSGIEIEGNKIDLPAYWIVGTQYGAPSNAQSMHSALTIRNQTLPFAMLGSPADGSSVFCSDCSATPACHPGGSGAFAKRAGGIWVCQ